MTKGAGKAPKHMMWKEATETLDNKAKEANDSLQNVDQGDRQQGNRQRDTSGLDRKSDDANAIKQNDQGWERHRGKETPVEATIDKIKSQSTKAPQEMSKAQEATGKKDDIVHHRK